MFKKLFNAKNQTNEITKKLKLPYENIFDDIVICMTGDSSIFVENYKGVLEYSSECIVLRGRKQEIKICGEHIFISYYTDECMKMTGVFRSVQIGCFRHL